MIYVRWNRKINGRNKKDKKEIDDFLIWK